jgi:dGTPase
LEAQVANLADEIAYYSHDLDDGLEAGLLKEKELAAHAEIWAVAARTVQSEHGDLPDECRRYFTIRCIIDGQVKDVVTTADQLIRDAGVRCADDVRRVPQPLISYSPARRKSNLELRDFLYQNLYYNPEVHEPNLRAVRMLADLFTYYLSHPTEIPALTRKRVETIGLHRVICDHISGMTDRSIAVEHQKIFQKSPA